MLSVKTISMAVSLLALGFSAHADEMVKNQALVEQYKQEMNSYIERTVGECAPGLKTAYRAEVNMQFATMDRLVHMQNRPLSSLAKLQAKVQKRAEQFKTMTCKQKGDAYVAHYKVITTIANEITRLEKVKGVGNVTFEDILPIYKKNNKVNIPFPMPQDSPAIGCLSWDVCELPAEPAVASVPAKANSTNAVL